MLMDFTDVIDSENGHAVLVVLIRGGKHLGDIQEERRHAFLKQKKLKDDKLILKCQKQLC